MTALDILLVSDGRPGHFRLSEGIVAAVDRRRPVVVTRVDVRRPRLVPGRALSALANAGAMDGALPRLLGYSRRPAGRCDLVVSAGGDTLAANVALARTYRCSNIFYGSLRRFRPEDFSLVLTSYVANATGSNVVMTLKPSAFDPTVLPARSLMAEDAQRVPVGLLIGGDSGTVKFSGEDWSRVVALVSDSSAAVSWIVCNSRRTPDEISDRIAGLASANSGRVRFIDVRSSGAPGLVEVFAACAAVMATIDSSSMISEAVWARRPVVVLAPERCGLPKLEESYRAYLRGQGWTSPGVALAEADPAKLLDAARELRPLAGNPLAALAGVIAQRVPALFQ